MTKQPSSIIHQTEREPEEREIPEKKMALIRRSNVNQPITFPVVGIGASAGGMQALENFFQNMPPKTGVAFVVIIHLDPNRKGMMPEVLQQFTEMPVKEITDGERLQQDHVYVIPPNKDVSVLHGHLLLLEPARHRGLRMPIDNFFQSLAKDQREKAICIIFSGMGSDGATGLKLVMENFGMVMVQDPRTAEFDSMPKQALKTEFVDFVLPPEKMPAQLLAYIKHPGLTRIKRQEENAANRPPHALDKIYALIRNQTGHDFSLYKRNTVYRRIERRMASHQIVQFPQYVRYLQENPAEVDLLFKELLIGVTKFFRDPEAFDLLKDEYLPRLIRSRPEGSTLRVWVAGCSTGEEAYSIAIVLLECLEKVGHGRKFQLQIFATDIDSQAIEKARAGIYPENIAGDISPERLRRFFTKKGNGYQIKTEVRETLVFAVHNITKDAPFTRLDLLCCRNLLIYFSSDLQRKLIPVFHYSLNPKGLLFLGSSETISGYPDLFKPLEIKWKISQRSESMFPLTRLAEFPFANLNSTMSKNSHPIIAKPKPEMTLPGVVQRVLVEQFAPPSVIINQKGDIFYVNGRTGKYLEPAAGQATLNVFEMARDGLKFELNSSVYKASSRNETVVAEPLKVQNEKGEQPIRLTVKPLSEPEQVKGLFLIVFEDLPDIKKSKSAGKRKPGKDAGQAEELEKELQFTRQRLQSTIEEMQSSLEELKSTNEELQSANEELQSTNEEAMTNREEMQSLNEELMTINAQYLSKGEELTRRNNDMKNLLDSTELATIFLDNELKIKSFTPQATGLFNIITADIGRPLLHISSSLQYEELAADVQEVLLKLITKEKEVPTTDGEHWFVVRLLPYRTADNFIDGVVITISDITKFKQLEAQLAEARELAENVIDAVRDPLVVVDGRMRIVSVSKAFSETFHIIPELIRGQLLYHLGNGQWDIPELRQLIERVFAENVQFNDYIVEHNFPNIGPRRMLLNARLVQQQASRRPLVLLGIQDITQ